MRVGDGVGHGALVAAQPGSVTKSEFGGSVGFQRWGFQGKVHAVGVGLATFLSVGALIGLFVTNVADKVLPLVMLLSIIAGGGLVDLMNSRRLNDVLENLRLQREENDRMAAAKRELEEQVIENRISSGVAERLEQKKEEKRNRKKKGS